MEEKHKKLITDNFSSLVEQTNLEYLLPILIEKEVFSYKMMEPFMDDSKEGRIRKSQLYSALQRRGPQAFDKLIDALRESGHWSLINLLAPEHELNTNFISIKEEKKTLPKKYPVMSGEFHRNDVPSNSRSFNPLPVGNYEMPPIKVIKATSFGVSTNPEIMCYSMKSKKRGVFFMINNIEFPFKEYRKGALNDQKNLKELFSQIGFHQIIIHNNKTKSEMETIISEFAVSKILEHTDCVFVIIASHGISKGDNETFIVTSDGNNIPTNKILDMFNSKNCSLLHNIPKVFIFQVCRGYALDYGSHSEPKVQPVMENNRTQLDGKSENVTLRTYSDMLIAHSTVPGFASHRDTKLGSWYMISLCKIFMEHAHHSHLEDLFRMVDSHLKDIPLKQSSVQTSSVENRGFNKHCYLNPGLFE